jgi:NAD(P)-dependent dehydrogenase (short-subunit alcohol dehydrogenase family)
MVSAAPNRIVDSHEPSGREKVMAGQFEGRVALITGAARGQGRSHAVRFAEEGADIIAIDICDQIDCVGYPMATREDLNETANLVEKTGRRIVAERGDVRDFKWLKTIVAYGDAVDVMLNGVYYTIEATLPALLDHGDGGAIVITSSTAGLNSLCPTFSVRSHGFAGYHAAKHGVVGLMRYYATSLAEKNIRVNSVHPTGVATPMLLNEPAAQHMAEHPEGNSAFENLLPVELVEPTDVSEAMVYLCGQTGRYITGITLPVDGGLTVK